MSQPKTSRRTRVPTALHSELTEYASLIRVLRTQHALDLSTHLSQVPSLRSSQVGDSDESELNLSDLDPAPKSAGVEDSHERISEAVDDEQETDGTYENGTDLASSVPGSSGPTTREASQEQETTQSTRATGKKRKRQPRDTWTRWPLLAGDVYPPEFGLRDEVQLIATQVLRQQSQRQPTSRNDNPENDEHVNSGGSGPTPTANDDKDGPEDELEDELGDIAIRALASSTAAHLRSLLSASASLVPRVEPIMRSRLAPLNWTGVLSAAAANGLASPEAIERVGARLQTHYSARSATEARRDPQPELPQHVRHSVSAAAVVRAAREKLNSMLQERVEQGDGDFLFPVGPPERTKKKKRTRKRRKKQESEAEGTSVLKDVVGEADKEGREQPSSQSEDDANVAALITAHST